MPARSRVNLSRKPAIVVTKRVKKKKETILIEVAKDQDIGEFVRGLSALLGQAQIKAILQDITVFLSDTERPVAIKEGWNRILSELDV